MRKLTAPLAFIILSFAAMAQGEHPSSILITHIRLIDGTGTPVRNASVRVLGDRIKEIGNLKAQPGEQVIDGKGKVLAPGFIDTHSHLLGSLADHPDAIAVASQGVTTIVSGQDGYGDPMDSLKAQLSQHPPAINVATYTGHTMLREEVMGAHPDRPATAEELEKMKSLLKTEMQKGSLGLSTGLEYEGAVFSSTEEVLDLARTVAEFHGRYISHIRSEDIRMPEAIDEIIRIGRETHIPVQISHIKIALKDDWGTAAKLLAKLEAVRAEGIDITADCYPYLYWSSTLKVLFPKTDYTSLESAQFAVDHTFDPAHSYLVRFAPNKTYAGQSIQAVAALKHQTPAATLISLIAEADRYQKANPDSGNVEGIVATSMREDDLMDFLAWPHTNICSDGSNGGHPRGYGTFPRVLGRYARDKKLFSLESAVFKMTGLAAEHCGLRQRGIIAPGNYADLVLFDPDTIKDNATIEKSKTLSDGIQQVWVNGICVYRQGHTTHQFPGTLITKQ